MSGGELFSENWYRVASLKPRLAEDVAVYQHRYRGVPCYVLQRPGRTQLFRADTTTFELIEMMDGDHSVADIWSKAVEAQDEAAPTQQQFEALLGQLNEAEFLALDGKSNFEALFARGNELRTKRRKQRYLNPLYMRFALLDPDRLLTRLAVLTGWLFNRKAFCCWLAMLLLALTQVASNWSQLRYEIAGFDLFAPEHLLALLISYPLLKLLHELAHGLFVRRFGGEVHELGIALMVLLPIPFVDASVTGSFPEKHRRMLVGAAGIFVELGVAAAATLAWVASAPGAVHDLMLMLMLLGGLSTVLFNGNPLLKFDGYYILADAIEIPNLADRSRRYLLSKLQRVVIGQARQVEPVQDGGEAAWLVGYGLLSMIYRFALMLGIAYFLSGQYFFFGILLAGWILFSLVVRPALKTLRFIQQETGNRGRAVTASLALAGAVYGLLFLLPLPDSTAARGVVWLPEDALVRAAHRCEIEQVFAEPGATVAEGQPLLECADPELVAELESALAELDEVSARHAGVSMSDRVQRQVLVNERDTLLARVENLKDKVARLRPRAGVAGQFVPAKPGIALAGRFAEQGEIIAFVIPERERAIKVALVQEDLARLDRSDRIGVQFVQNPGARNVYPSRVQRQTPKADFEVSSAALTTRGGGDLPADPSDDRGQRTKQPVFELELAWPDDAPPVDIGGHVWVRFEHSAAPLADRLIIELRRAFLGHLAA